MPGGGTLTVGAVDTPDGLDLFVGDSGPGLPADVVSRVFEPFFTTKPSGTGLGLAIVSRIAEAHGGSVTAGNTRQGGAVFTLRLPSPSGSSAACALESPEGRGDEGRREKTHHNLPSPLAPLPSRTTTKEAA
jgi:two-component system sensor histidine kinase HydH